MDDIRRPDPQRRDYSLPRANYAPPAAPSGPPPQEVPVQPAPPGQPLQPVQAQPPDRSFTPVSQAPYPAAEVPQEVVRTPYQPPSPQPPAAEPKSKIVHFFPYKYVATGLAAVLILGAAGYFVSRPAKKAGFTAAQLAQKSSFSFYYPQPAPSGYSYITEQNAFQNGQAYFMIGKGNKHIVFHEQTAATAKLDTSSLSKPQMIEAPAGKAAVGTLAGQPAAKVLAGSTLISVNSTGGVSQDDVTTAVKSLKSTK